MVLCHGVDVTGGEGRQFGGGCGGIYITGGNCHLFRAGHGVNCEDRNQFSGGRGVNVTAEEGPSHLAVAVVKLKNYWLEM